MAFSDASLFHFFSIDHKRKFSLDRGHNAVTSFVYRTGAERWGIGVSAPARPEADLFIIGGGINGCGIARDAAGRGLSVILAEQGDLAQATSSASTKLFHGGLRYLEFFEFRLVREALEERETLLAAMPHISWPMRFVLPYSPEMRFPTDTPTSRVLSFAMPWLRGRRPAWLIRLGLFLYDNLGGRRILPGTKRLDLSRDPLGKPLKPGFRLGWEYSDCWVQDSRLVVLNARDAQARGATVLTRTRVTHAERVGRLWRITTEGAGGARTHHARALVNAGGPWVEEVIRDVAHIPSTKGVRLVRGSHIVVPRLYDHDRCYFFQGEDGRIIFAIPFEEDFTLIGTTDMDHQGPPGEARCSEAERDYLCAFASRYFAKAVTPGQVVWTYSGVRPLYDDGAKSATAATRDYVLSLHDGEAGGGAPLLNVFGGKITTYRRLAESALAKLAPFFPQAGDDWTARVPLPGGDFPADGAEDLVAQLQASHPFLPPRLARRLVRTYGTEAFLLLDGADSMAALGRDFGAGLTEAEVTWLIRHEFAQSAEDILWRRTKLGLHMTEAQRRELEAFLDTRHAAHSAAE